MTQTRSCYRCKQIYEVSSTGRLCGTCKQTCSICHRYFSVSPRAPRSVRRGDFRCMKCLSKHPSNIKASLAYNRTTRLEKEYGITAQEYDAILSYQYGSCAICGTTPKTRRLSIDHQHIHQDKKHRGIECRERVRGLLCHRCNFGLQRFKDNIEILQHAIWYLQNTPAQLVLRRKK